MAPNFFGVAVRENGV